MRAVVSRVVLVGVLALLAGCVATPSDPRTAKEIKATALAEKTAERNVKVTVLRDHGEFVGAGADSYVHCDETRIADISPNQMTVFYTTPGKHVISCRSWIGDSIQISHFSEFKENEEAEFHCNSSGIQRTK